MRLTSFLIVTICVIAAATAAIWLKLMGVDAATAGLCGFVLILIGFQVRAGNVSRRERRTAQREIARLRQSGVEFNAALDETRARMDEMRASLEAANSAQQRKIVSELQVLESLMREFAARIAEKSREAPREEPRALEARARDTARSYLDSLGQSDLLEIIRASLEENRVDLYLQPIVTLPQRKLKYYEALSRLRAEDGSVIMPAQYMKVAAPAGLMSVVDNLLLFRCVQIVRRMIVKTKDSGVFCNISGDTLTDEEFFPQFLEYMHHNRDLAHQIVFEFAQGAVAAAGTKGEANLSYLSRLGFALSMDHVTSLALDFGKLRALGFRYIKVNAQTLVTGMAGAASAVTAEDLKKLLARNGLNLIAERVEDEKTVVQLLDYNVDFGQGFLFGEPRAVREEGAKPADSADAAAIIPFRRTA